MSVSPWNPFKRLSITLAAALVLSLVGGRLVAADDGGEQPSSDFDLSRSQLTFGPKHHLFGYIGQSLTIPWNANDRYVLALQTSFHDHLPGPDDVANVVMVDTRNNDQVVALDETRAWNLQQGTMFYWNPEASETQFLFNDRDPTDGRVFAVLYDIEKRQRIREFRFASYSLGNSGVSPKGKVFAAINYGRMARLRPVTGYAGAMDHTVGVRAPNNDGIFLIDIGSGNAKVLVSFQQLADLIENHPNWAKPKGRWIPVEASITDAARPPVNAAELYINHTLFNRTGDRIYFFARGRKDGRAIWIDVPCSIKTDGTEFVVHTVSIGGHPEWAEGNFMIGANNESQVVYDVVNRKIVAARRLGNAAIFPDPEGDISLSPDGQWLVNGYPSQDRRSIRYVVMRIADGAYVRSEAFDRGPYRRGNLRTDPAPRWNRASDSILVPGWTRRGTRQLFVLSIEEQ